MKYFKKRTLSVVFLLMVVLVLSGAAAAGTVFNDVDEGRWSEQSIAEMKAKNIVGGFSDGSYAPTDPVTREQLIVMLVRTIGKQAEAAGTIPLTFTYRDEVSNYAKGSIAYAVREGIITGSDLMDKPKEPVVRYEVAVLALRAMGLSQKAESTSVSLVDYTDASDIPAWAMGYVALAGEKGIMGGLPDGSFNPMGNVTREQMAAVLSRVDDQVNVVRDNVIKGEVYAISASTKSVSIKNYQGIVVPVTVSEDAFIYRNGQKINYLNLESSEKLEIVKDEEGKAQYMEVISDEEFMYDALEVEGVIEGIITGDPSIITIKLQDGTQEVYSLTDETVITMEGNSITQDDLVPGYEITGDVSGQVITELCVSETQQILNGFIDEVDISTQSLIIKDNYDREYDFQTDADTKIDIDGDEAELEDLISGQEVMVIYLGETAENITADDYDWEIEAEFREIDFAEGEITVINSETGLEETYNLYSRVDIEKDDDDATLRDLVPGDDLKLELENNEVRNIEAETIEKEVEGWVEEITVSTAPRIVIENEDNEQFEYNISSDADIEKNRADISLSEINPGDWVEMKIQGQYAVEIDVEARISSEYIIGDVIKVYEDELVLVVKDKDTRENNTILLNDDVDIIRFGKLREIDDIDEGDEVIVVGDPDKEFFMAATIVVVGTVD
jgi:hypothetical protein